MCTLPPYPVCLKIIFVDAEVQLEEPAPPAQPSLFAEL
jgi:hypothetical protein